MSIYLKYGSIAGQVSTEGFKDWIELTSFQLGVHRSFTTGSGGAQREGTHPAVSEVTVTKPFDLASAKIFQDSLAGAWDTKADLKFTTTSKNKVETYLHYELTACGVSSYTVTSTGDNPVEQITINFTKIMVAPSPLDEKGAPKAGSKVIHDLLLHKTS